MLPDLANLDISLKLSILSFMDQKTQSLILKDTKNERLPSVRFSENIKKDISPDHFLQPSDFQALDTKGYIIKDSFLGPDKLQQLLSEAQHLHQSGQLQKAGMGTGSSDYWQNSTARSDLVLWLNSILEPSFALPVPSIKSLVQRLDYIREELNEDIQFDSHKTQMHVTCYPGNGARYMRHLDAYVGASTRRLTFLYYMNKDWKEGDGGELRIFDPTSGTNGEEEKHVDIAPVGDRLVIFQSRLLEHEVLPTSAHRFTLTVWFY